MDTLRLLDILGFVVGLVYLWLEYKASIWLWLAGIVMPAIDLFLYYKAGLYADFGMAVYYCLAGGYTASWPGSSFGGRLRWGSRELLLLRLRALRLLLLNLRWRRFRRLIPGLRRPPKSRSLASLCG